jgi:putative membrane-bound dehydrogenase-like protein
MRRLSPLVLLLPFFLLPFSAADEPKTTPAEGVLPVGADGKPLNLDFETGTLKDWSAEGEAFKGQPIKGDTVAARRGDMKSQHQGQYWIGGYERLGDKPEGTLTSVPFKVTHPWASFLIGGGASPETCVELVRADTKEVFSRTSGLEEENMRRVAIDLKALQGKEIFIRIVDHHTGGWGHVNFDDFRFHSEKPNVPERPKRDAPPVPDTYKYAGLTPEKAAAAMTVPEGFEVKLFAGEPDVKQPIAMAIDHRGRLWVAEAYSYPQRQPEGKGKDRILIFEDSDGDGKFDKRTVFMEGLNLVSGLEVGFGGVWIGAAPYLMFVPVKEGEDKPAGEPKILLDGWAYQDTHETLNTFTWGPDGWLYGCHGVFTHSRVGKPGTPDKDRTPINAGVWRYHPTKHIFEVFAHGTSNPWGLDFDEHGQAFVEACVVPHCFHIIQGGRYLRQAGAHFNPYTYADIDTIADHLHWQGTNQWAGNLSSGSKGGGHAHAGLMVYQGGAWPEQYRGQLFMGNIHGHRLNMDLLKPKGSGFVASHGPDFLQANDAWARFINMRVGPDGNVYLIDWYDKQACHTGDVNIWDRSNGRIYKVCYRGTKPVTVDLTKKTDAELFAFQTSDNVWYVQHSRQILQERKAAGTLGVGWMSGNKSPLRLRDLWVLHATEGFKSGALDSAVESDSPYIRAWAIQLFLEDRDPTNAFLKKMASMAKDDKSPIVRLYLASGLQRIPAKARWDVIEALLAHGEDATDHNLPQMYWYAAEPLAEVDASRALTLASKAKIPSVYPFMVRRIASSGTAEAMGVVIEALGKADEARQLTILRSANEALQGRNDVAKPKEWPELFATLSKSANADVRAQAVTLGVTFGDAGAIGLLRKSLTSTQEKPERRLEALAALIGRDRELAPVLHSLLNDSALRGPSIKALASYDDSKTPEILIAAYPSLSAQEKRDVLATLSARASYGRALMSAVAAKKVPSADVPAETIRQLGNLKDAELDKLVAQAWGIVRKTPADRLKQIADWKKKLTAPAPEPDLALGRALFAKTCQQCHTLYGVGGKVGPDITGSNRANLDYLLENIFDPSAVVPNEYKMSLVELKSGQIVSGILKPGVAGVTNVLLSDGNIRTIQNKDIESTTTSNQSLMPEDQLKNFTETEVRALVAYLRNPTQTQILATPENAKDFFNGKDLTGWDADPKLWSVVDGEIVGKSPGIKKNDFMKSQLTATDFRLTLKLKLVPNKENSGVQFRSEALPDGEMRGPQADVGEGWWGKLYEESARGLIWKESGEKHVKVDDWNEYVIEAIGSKVKTWINGQLCVNLDDEKISRRGIFGLQIHSGGPMEVRFKDLKLEVLTPASGK